MKVWTKNRNYKIEVKEDGRCKVYNGDRVIATAVDEYNARQAIWIAIGGREPVYEEDFKEVEDEK